MLNPADKEEASRKKIADDNNGKTIDAMAQLVHDEKLKKMIEEQGEFDEKQLNPAEDHVVELVSQNKMAEAQKYFIETYLPLRAQYNKMSEELGDVAAAESKKQESAIADGMRAAAVKIITLLLLGLCVVIGAIVFTVLKLSGNLNAVIAKLSEEALTLADSSEKISDSSASLSERTSEQAAALQETMASVEAVTSGVRQNAERSKTSKDAADSSQIRAMDGKKVVDEMIDSIRQLTASNNRIMEEIEASNTRMNEIVTLIDEIGNKTKLINDIVFQTKLLSFNASVEAARAGEQGKGFAVVADEVGNLAAMSGQAAHEIRQLLDGSTKKVQAIAAETKTQVAHLMIEAKEKLSSGSQVATRCGTVLDDILAKASDVTTMMSEVSSASNEQSQNISEINRAIHQLEEVTQRNSAASQEASTSAVSLSAQATHLRELVDELQQQVAGDRRKAA